MPVPDGVTDSPAIGTGRAYQPVTVFVGDLPDPRHVHDGVLQIALQACGTLNKWDRGDGHVSRAQRTFGFATYATAHGALHAVEALDGYRFSTGPGGREQPPLLLRVSQADAAALTELSAAYADFRAARDAELAAAEGESEQVVARAALSEAPNADERKESAVACVLSSHLPKIQRWQYHTT